MNSSNNTSQGTSSKQEKSGNKKPKILTVLYYILFSNGPWLMTVLVTIIWGYFLLGILPKEATTRLTIIVIPAIPISLILTSWIQVILTKKLLDYYTLKKVFSARYMLKRASYLTFSTISLAFLVYYLFAKFYLNIVIAMDTYLLLYFFTLSLSFLWVYLAPLNGLQKYAHTTSIFSFGLSIGYGVSYLVALWGYPATYIVVALSAGYMMAALLLFGYMFFKLYRKPSLSVKLDAMLMTKILEAAQSYKEKEELAKVLPTLLRVKSKLSPDEALIILDKSEIDVGRKESIISAIRDNKWLFIANLSYFTYLWLDRFLVWLKTGVSLTGLFLGFNSIYEAGLNIAQWALIPTVGYAAYLMTDFTHELIKTFENLYVAKLQDIKSSLKRFRSHVFIKAGYLTLFTIVSVLVVLFFGNTFLSFFKVLNETSYFILLLASVAVVFHALLLYSYFVLMYLGKLENVSIAMILPTIVSLATCLIVYFTLPYGYMILGYLFGSAAGAIAGLLEIKKILSDLYREYLIASI